MGSKNSLFVLTVLPPSELKLNYALLRPALPELGAGGTKTILPIPGCHLEGPRTDFSLHLDQMGKEYLCTAPLPLHSRSDSTANIPSHIFGFIRRKQFTEEYISVCYLMVEHRIGFTIRKVRLG